MTDSSEFPQLEWRDIKDELFSFEVEIEGLIREIQEEIAKLKKKQTPVIGKSNVYWQVIAIDENSKLQQLYEAVREYLVALVDNRIVQTISIRCLLERYRFVHPEVLKQDIFLKIAMCIAKRYAHSIDNGRLQQYLDNYKQSKTSQVNTIITDAHFAVYNALQQK